MCGRDDTHVGDARGGGVGQTGVKGHGRHCLLQALVFRPARVTAQHRTTRGFKDTSPRAAFITVVDSSNDCLKINDCFNKVDTYLRRAGYIEMKNVGFSISQWLPCPLAIWTFALDGNLVKSCLVKSNYTDLLFIYSTRMHLHSTGQEEEDRWCPLHNYSSQSQ